MATRAAGTDTVTVDNPLPYFTASPLRCVAVALHTRLDRISETINETAALLAPQVSLSPQPEDEPPAKIRRLPKFRASPAIAWKRRLATRMRRLTTRTENLRDTLSPYAAWQLILAQMANHNSELIESLADASVQVWRETEGVGLQHVSEAIDRYSGLSPNEIDTVLDRITAETLHERIWLSLQEFIPEGEEATEENVEAACEAFLKKYPDIAKDDVREAVGRFANTDEPVARWRPS